MVGYKLEVKVWALYKTMKRFILQINNYEVSKGMAWVIDILFEKTTPQKRISVWKMSFEHYTSKVSDFMESSPSFITSLAVDCTVIDLL